MKKHTGSPALEQIVFEISQKYNIEQIYLNKYDRDVVPNELIILMSNKHLKTLGLLVPQVINTIKNFPTFTVKCYIAFQVKDKIREGNLFLFSSCQPHKLVYQKESSNFTPIANNLDFTQCLEKALELTDRELKKIDEFREGYYHFKKIKKYSLAVFMLHQTLELTYRYLELLLSAKEKITHSIRCHHLHLREISAIYTCIFEENDEDIFLLQVLEEVYRATRYENNFHIDLETLKRLEQKMESLSANAKEIFDHMINALENEHLTG
ncbi:MAG: hypothetical protein ACTIJ2_13995 [Sphingobacteriaceae bacterium]